MFTRLFSTHISFLLLLAFILSSNVVDAQSQIVDSLTNELKVNQSDSNRIAIKNRLGWELRGSDPDLSLKYAREALALAKKKGFIFLSSYSHNLIAIYHKNRGEYEQAILHISDSYRIRKRYGDSIMVAQTSLNLGNVYRSQGVFDSATYYYRQSLSLTDSSKAPKYFASYKNAIGTSLLLQDKPNEAVSYFYEALAIREILKDSVALASSYIGLGNFHQQMNHQEEAMDYYLLAQKIFKSQEDYKQESQVLMNMGVILTEASDYDGAKEALMRAEKLLKRIEAYPSLAQVFGSIGTMYAHEHEWDLALAYQLKSVKLNRLHRDAYNQAISLRELASIYSEMGDHNLGLTSLEEGLPIARKAAVPSLIADYLFALSIEHRELGNKDLALKYSFDYTSLHDSIIDSNQEANYLENKLANERLHNIILQKGYEARLEKSRRKTIEYEADRNRYYVLFFGLIGIIASMLIFWRWRVSKFKERETKNRLEKVIQQRETDSLDAMLEGQEKERIRVAKDLHDNLGALLSALKIIFGLIKKEVKEVEHLDKDLLSQANRLIDETTFQVRQITDDLKSGILDEFGVVPALKDLCKNTEIKDALFVKLYAESVNEHFPRLIERPLLKIVCEGINNVIKHAKADQVTIQLLQSENRVHLSIEDDGSGFDLTKVNYGNGLHNMRNRTEKYNGTFQVDSQMGHGTTILIDFDLKKLKDE